MIQLEIKTNNHVYIMRNVNTILNINNIYFYAYLYAIKYRNACYGPGLIKNPNIACF